MIRNTVKFVPIALIALVATSLVACGGGPRLLKGEPPQVSINSLTRVNSNLQIELRLHNINHVPMDVSRISLTLTLDDYPLRVEENLPALHLDASTTEMARFTVPLPAEVDRQLADVESGARASLSHELSGVITERDGKDLRFRREGHLYPVPGRPGQFR